MVGIGVGFHFQLPGNSKQRILHPAKVLGCYKGGVYTAEVEDPALALKDGLEILLYFERNREFMQQSARIDSIEESDTQPVITLTTTGDPVSAESRQCYRTSTVMIELTAEVGSERGCRVLDVSSTGFAVVASQRYSVGKILDATIGYEGKSYNGKLSVQSVRELSPGRIRYGLHCTEAKKTPGNLAQGLQQMSIQIQRAQLRRLAGAV